MSDDLDRLDCDCGEKEVDVNRDFSGLKINLNGKIDGDSLDGVSGTIEGPDGIFLLNVSLSKDGDNVFPVPGGP